MKQAMSNRILGLREGEHAMFTAEEAKNLRGLVCNAGKRWNRKFSVHKVPEGFRVTRHADRAATDSETLELLREARVHLPIAAASWNEDESPEVATYHVAKVLELISKVDAVLARSAA